MEASDMWHCSNGVRKLQGKEAELFRGAALLLDQVVRDCMEFQPADGSFPSETEIFDEMTLEQQHLAVSFTLKALLSDDPAPDLEAWSEATIYAVFEKLKGSADLEADVALTDDEDPTYWRRLINQVWMEHCHGHEGKACGPIHPEDRLEGEDEEDSYIMADLCPPGKGCHLPDNSKDMEEWEDKIELISDLILWDRDFESPTRRIMMQRDARTLVVGAALGIHPNYYASMPMFGMGARRRLEEFRAEQQRQDR